MTTVWLLGRYLTDAELADDPYIANWALEGIFTTEAKALEHGKRDWGWFVAKAPLDKIYAPGEVAEFPDFRWLQVESTV